MGAMERMEKTGNHCKIEKNAMFLWVLMWNIGSKKKYKTTLSVKISLS